MTWLQRTSPISVRGTGGSCSDQQSNMLTRPWITDEIVQVMWPDMRSFHVMITKKSPMILHNPWTHSWETKRLEKKKEELSSWDGILFGNFNLSSFFYVSSSPFLPIDAEVVKSFLLLLWRSMVRRKASIVYMSSGFGGKGEEGVGWKVLK